MTNSLSDILADKWDEPPEIKLIKNYVQKKYREKVGVSVSARQINITVPNAALAGALQLNKEELLRELGPSRRLAIRIGSTS